MIFLTFMISNGNIFFQQIFSEKSKLSVWGEIWYLEQFEYEGFGGDVHFSVFSEVSFFGQICSKKSKLFVETEL